MGTTAEKKESGVVVNERSKLKDEVLFGLYLDSRCLHQELILVFVVVIDVSLYLFTLDEMSDDQCGGQTITTKK